MASTINVTLSTVIIQFGCMPQLLFCDDFACDEICVQGVPDWFQFPVSQTEAYRQIGNGVSVPVGKWIGNEITRYMRK
ncbi:DNA cytosine methyltransferase [Xenorhabdus bovienii]|uniref:DNA cytosine methyltransferase n=1 Tax=Xenorhabdus bovienii TaxID=40576 RepID=UPI0023B29071|nr:DNA cytosine methyltransferase [Xenorhabdus bovienii]